MRSGELARTAGVSRDTLRYYERKGVLPKPRRSDNNYREYPDGALDRLQVIRAALAIGFTLEELASCLRSRETGGVPCGRVRELAAGKLARLDELVRELSSLRDTLRVTLRQWDRALARTPPGRRARLLDHLARDMVSSSVATRAAAFILQRRRMIGVPR